MKTIKLFGLLILFIIVGCNQNRIYQYVYHQDAYGKNIIIDNQLGFKLITTMNRPPTLKYTSSIIGTYEQIDSLKSVEYQKAEKYLNDFNEGERLSKKLRRKNK